MAEEATLAVGVRRIKFKSTRKGNFEDILQKEESWKRFLEICEVMAMQLHEMEKYGAAPILPDGKVGGNAAHILEFDEDVNCAVVVSKSGKEAGANMKIPEDFVILSDFDHNNWTCDFYSCSTDVLPTSDSPMHFSILNYYQGSKDFPRYALHGHAFQTSEEAEKFGFPCTSSDTLFSTRADTESLLQTIKANPYPNNQVFIRKDHGFFLLAKDTDDAWKVFMSSLAPYLDKKE